MGNEKIFFNLIVDLLYADKPGSHGNYLPYLKTAQKFMGTSTNAACQLSLVFLSDGHPSDNVPRIIQQVELIASEFQGRLTIKRLRYGPSGESLNFLESMGATAIQHLNANP